MYAFFHCVFVTFPCGVLGQVWCLIVSIPDLCLSYFAMSKDKHKYEQVSSKRYKLTCTPIKDSDQPAHPQSLIRVFNVRSMGNEGSNVSSHRKLYASDYTVPMRRLISVITVRTSQIVPYAGYRLQDRAGRIHAFGKGVHMY